MVGGKACDSGVIVFKPRFSVIQTGTDLNALDRQYHHAFASLHRAFENRFSQPAEHRCQNLKRRLL
jgi:hypothetical protein